MTGKVAFDGRGRRMNYTLYIYEKPVNSELQIIGKWDSNTSTITETRTTSEIKPKPTNTKKLFKVSTRPKYLP